MPRKNAKKTKARQLRLSRRRMAGNGRFMDQEWWGNVGRGMRSVLKPVSEVAEVAAGLLGGNRLERAVNRTRKIIGLGAYGSVGSNALLASPVPIMHDMTDRGIRIQNHEYIGDITSSVDLFTKVFNINPGDPSTFPWLSGIASSFQKWEPLGICFYFKATSATALNSTNTALGTIVGACQYDVSASTPATKPGIVNLSGSQSGVPCQDNVYPVECAPSMRITKNLLVRASGPSTLADLQKYDLAKFILATVGSQAAAVVGELHVTYDIVLKIPLPSGAVGNNLGQYHATYTSLADNPMFAVSKAYDPDLNLTVTAKNWQKTEVMFPAGSSGTYLIHWMSGGRSGATPSYTFAGTNTVQVNALGDHLVSTKTIPVVGTSSANVMLDMVVSVVDTTRPATFAWLPNLEQTIADGSIAELIVVRLNDAF